MRLEKMEGLGNGGPCGLCLEVWICLKGYVEPLKWPLALFP